MSEKNVLSLGEMIVLSARLATIEHVRQEMAAIAKQRSAGVVGDDAADVTDDAEAATLSRPAADVLGDVFARIEKATTMPRVSGRRRKAA